MFLKLRYTLVIHCNRVQCHFNNSYDPESIRGCPPHQKLSTAAMLMRLCQRPDLAVEDPDLISILTSHSDSTGNYINSFTN
jgi:hypothetical protein